jgi:Arc/MetJ-type ribon-helix-helix transcriptional regulator
MRKWTGNVQAQADRDFETWEVWGYNKEMSIEIRLTPRGEAIVQKLLATGAYRSAEEVVERALEVLEEKSRKAVKDAIDDIIKLREGNTLVGLKIRDLINEGRKY